MSRIWSMMDIGKRSMMNNQTALQTVSHNIANKSTEGYSRQRVELQTAEPTGTGKLRIGNGSRAAMVTRTNNPYIEKQIQKETVNLGGAQTRADAMGRVEQVYNEQSNKGLNKYMGEFFNAFRSLSNNPESLAARTQVKESADFLARDFQRVNGQLKSIQGDIDFQLSTHIAEINDMTKEIANLNEKIKSVELNGIPANDERDRRDMLLKRMGETINIRYTEGEDGGVTVMAGSTAVLVSGFSHRDLLVSATGEREGKAEGHYDVFYKSTESGTPVNITHQIVGGKIGGLLRTRDQTINGLIEKNDSLAYQLGTKVNEAHMAGVDRYNKKAVRIFDLGAGPKGASENIKINAEVTSDVGKIASAAMPDSPGDNRVANIISDLQYRDTMGQGESNFDEYYGSMVGEVGVQTSRANADLSSQSGLVSQLKNIRESISGVSLDEETTKLIEYQKGFEASARLIKASDEMMDTVLNIKRG